MNAIEIYANHRQMLDSELALFAELYTGKQPDVICQLIDKIKHMCNHIGCPSSVMPMLKSIANGKKKIWSDSWDTRGKQMRGYTAQHLQRLEREVEDRAFIRGHFRWGQGFMVDRQTRDYIQEYFFDKNIIKLKEEARNKGLKGGFRISIASAHVQNWGDGTFTVEVKTTKGNDYRYHYYKDGNRVSSNFGPGGSVTPTEREWVLKMVGEYRMKHNIYT